MCHIEVVRLRAGCGNMFSARLLNVLFALRHALVVVTYTNNLRHTAEESGERLDYCWGKLHGPLLARDMRCVRVAHKPSGIRVEPHVETMLLNRFNHFVGHSCREVLLID